MTDAASTAQPVDGSTPAGEVASQATVNPRKPVHRREPRGRRLARFAGVHALLAVAALSLFAAADSWHVVTGLGIAGLLVMATAALAGVTVVTLVHEWFHYLGARYARAAFDIPERLGLFVFTWDFARNSTRQFLTMSYAGTVGSVLALWVLWHSVPADTLGRAVLPGAAFASLVYSALIEWPVVRRVRRGGEPLAELSRIDQALLTRSAYIAAALGIAATLLAVS